MILMDFTPVVMANLFMHMKHLKENGEIQTDLVRHMVFDSIRAMNVRFSSKYGRMILCFDGRRNWRKEVFKEYKANRKVKQAQDDMDWDAFYEVMNVITQDVKDNLPYLCLLHERAEADDVIGSVTKYVARSNPKERILILSSDGDFKQLQKYGKQIDQYSPIMDKWIKSKDPEGELFEKVVRGDSGDGVPNIKSPDDIFLKEGERQKQITKKFLESLTSVEEKDIGKVLQGKEIEYYARNREMIDLDYTPKEVRDEIIDMLIANEIKGNLQSLMSYFSKNRMVQLNSKLEEFRVYKPIESRMPF